MMRNKSVAWRFKSATCFFIFFLLLSTVGIGIVASGQVANVDDTTPPTIDFVPPTPASGSTVTVNYVNVTVSVTDTSGVSTVVFNWSGVPEIMNMIGNDTWSVNKTNLSEGAYEYQVRANDTCDNWGTSEIRDVNVAEEAPTVSIEPASQVVSGGDTFTVDVIVDPVEYGVSSGSITVSFDATVMQVDSAGPGDLLGANPFVPPGFPKIDNTNGTVQVEYARLGVTTPPTPKGAFATIVLTVKSDAPDGTYPIVAATVELIDENFANIQGIMTDDGTVTVVPPGYPRWDINEDGKVDYKDLAMLGAHYGEITTPPYPRWDVNEDGKVDYKDLAMLGAHYGETYT